jgi:hypothetical protein
MLKSSDSKKSKHSAPVAAPRQAWHAVSVVSKGPSCEAAHAARSKRFLSANAPRLPLEACTTPKTCVCAYKHYPDRRGQPRRKDEAMGLPRNNKVSQERRADPDRRKTD